jgi:hypothetical protein
MMRKAALLKLATRGGALGAGMFGTAAVLSGGALPVVGLGVCLALTAGALATSGQTLGTRRSRVRATAPRNA